MNLLRSLVNTNLWIAILRQKKPKELGQGSEHVVHSRDLVNKPSIVVKNNSSTSVYNMMQFEKQLPQNNQTKTQKYPPHKKTPQKLKKEKKLRRKTKII